MRNTHVSILIPSRDAEELMQLLQSDDIPSCYCQLADETVDRLDAALDENKPRASARAA